MATTAAALKNVIITGASSGVGKALALKMAERGSYRLFLIGRNKDALEDVVSSCRKSTEADYGVGDVGSTADSGALLEQYRKTYGSRVDVLVANAGV